MDYLTNYYKNLCEEKQKQIIVLEQQLNETAWEDFAEISRNLLNYPTHGKISRGIGKLATGIGSGLSLLGNKLKSVGEKELEVGQEFNLPVQAAMWHDHELQWRAEKIIKNIPEFIEQHKEQISREDLFSTMANSQEDEQLAAHAKKRGNKGKSRSDMREELRKQRIDALEKTIPSRVLGTIASEINLLSKKDIEARRRKTKERGYESPLRPNDAVTGVVEHHGGHGPHMAHPELLRLQSEAKEGGVQIPRELWDKFGHHSTFHVAEEFQGLLDKKLQKQNNTNQQNFEQAVGAVQEFINKQKDLKSNVPFKMMESKNVFLNNKIKYFYL